MTIIDYGHWDISHVGEFNSEDYYGFVYLVTNILTGRKYIGKKSMWSTCTKQVWKKDRSGKKNTKVTKESPWRSYTTSSKLINAEILLGTQFTFEILSLHTSKGTLAYSEVDHMVKRDVLRLKLSNGDRAYYNGCIPGIKFLPPEEITEETKKKIGDAHRGKLVSEETKAKLSATKKGKPSPKKGKPGKTHSDETKAKLSAAGKGRVVSEESKAKSSATQKGRIFSEETKAKISAAKKGKTLSEEHKAKLKEAAKNRKPPKPKEKK